MNFTRKFLILSLIILLILSLLITGCEPPVSLAVENQTDQIVRLYVQGDPYFEVPPHQTVKGNTAIIIFDKFFVEALNTSGDIVYSRTFTHKEFVNPKFKIIIMPIETNPYLPLEVDNNSTYPIEVKVNSALMIGWLGPGTTLKRRPLPSDVSVYTIEVIGYTGPASYKTLLNKTFTRAELEQMNWKIIVENLG